MPVTNRVPAALLALRLTVFLVMLVWTLDKFLAPGHAAKVFRDFYFISDLAPTALYALGAVELAIIVGFVLGIAKTFTYGAVLAFHAISTLSSFSKYLNPAEGRLYYAAWPMLAACFALFLLRDQDTLCTWRCAGGARRAQ
jgi:hypothetical protein